MSLLDSLTTDDEVILEPQPGPQTEFCETEADIAIIGGSAGGGKTIGVILETLGNIENKGFDALILRRQFVDIAQQGGIWSDTQEVYPIFGAKANNSTLVWSFPSGATVGFGHMADAKKDHKRYKSASLPLIVFEELTEFEEHQFWYMLSRNRSACGIRPYIRATTNPEPGWLADLLMDGGYVDRDTGYAIESMSGVIRYIVRDGDDLYWFDSKAEAIEKFPSSRPLSFTFIRSKLSDNKKLLEADPDYEAKLMALPLVERERLLGGNWKIKPAAGKVFKDHWFRVIDYAPHPKNFKSIVRYWDLAATEPDPNGNADPDWTAGTLMAMDREDNIYILDLKHFREGPLETEKNVLSTADQDDSIYSEFGRVRVCIECDPGQAGKSQVAYYRKKLIGHTSQGFLTDGKSKIQRAGPFSSQVGNGTVFVVKAPWNQKLINQHHEFPDGAKKDIVDSCSGAFNAMTGKKSSFASNI